MSRKIHRPTYLSTERACRLGEYHNRVVLYIFFDKSLQVRHLVNGRLGRLCSLSLQGGNRVTYDEIMWLWSWENSWVSEKSGTSHGQLYTVMIHRSHKCGHVAWYRKLVRFRVLICFFLFDRIYDQQWMCFIARLCVKSQMCTYLQLASSTLATREKPTMWLACVEIPAWRQVI